MLLIHEYDAALAFLPSPMHGDFLFTPLNFCETAGKAKND